MAREPSKAQFSKLAYEERVPAFLQKLKARIAGQPVEEDEPSYDEGEGEWEESGDGRPAIPRRPGIPERPKEGEWGSSQVGKEGEHGSGRDGKEDDDDGDDAPQIVVLKAGKHLTSEDVENERRAAKGLPPLPKARPTDPSPQSTAPPAKPSPLKDNKAMNFSSSNKKTSAGAGASAKKRKAIGADDEPSAPVDTDSKPSKKPKKAKKALLSFQDDDG